MTKKAFSVATSPCLSGEVSYTRARIEPGRQSVWWLIQRLKLILWKINMLYKLQVLNTAKFSKAWWESWKKIFGKKNSKFIFFFICWKLKFHIILFFQWSKVFLSLFIFFLFLIKNINISMLKTCEISVRVEFNQNMQQPTSKRNDLQRKQ